LLSWWFASNEAAWLFIYVHQSRQISLTEFRARLAKLGFDLQTHVVKALFKDFDLSS
jgi:Ca2+-binding EF-hand superfamily protein